jgi:hypothetical protein
LYRRENRKTEAAGFQGINDVDNENMVPRSRAIAPDIDGFAIECARDEHGDDALILDRDLNGPKGFAIRRMRYCRP